MSLLIQQKTLKNLDFWKTCVKISYVIHPKASIHTKQRCGPIEKMPGCTYTNWANFAQFHRANLSEICSTCISTVRHTRHKFLCFFFPKIPTGVPIFVGAFLKDPYEYGHLVAAFFKNANFHFSWKVTGYSFILES